MKKLLTLTAITLIAACASPDATSSKFNAGLEKYNTNVEKVDAEFNYFENGDLQSMFDTASEDLIWNSPQGDSLSKNEWMEGMKAWHGNFENFKFTNRQYYPGVDDTEFLPDGGVRSYGVWTYNHVESGKEFETSYYSVQQFDEEGNTAFIWEFFDFGSIMLGLQ